MSSPVVLFNVISRPQEQRVISRKVGSLKKEGHLKKSGLSYKSELLLRSHRIPHARMRSVVELLSQSFDIFGEVFPLSSFHLLVSRYDVASRAFAFKANRFNASSFQRIFLAAE